MGMFTGAQANTSETTRAMRRRTDMFRYAELKELIATDSDSADQHDGDLDTDTTTIIGVAPDLQQKVVCQVCTSSVVSQVSHTLTAVRPGHDPNRRGLHALDCQQTGR